MNKRSVTSENRQKRTHRYRALLNDITRVTHYVVLLTLSTQCRKSTDSIRYYWITNRQTGNPIFQVNSSELIGGMCMIYNDVIVFIATQRMEVAMNANFVRIEIERATSLPYYKLWSGMAFFQHHCRFICTYTKKLKFLKGK